MRTILIAAVIAILAGIIYQKVVEENVSVKELAGYVAGTASEMINEASKAVNEKDLKGIEETINSVKENAGNILQEKRDNFIKEQLPEMINIAAKYNFLSDLGTIVRESTVLNTDYVNALDQVRKSTNDVIIRTAISKDINNCDKYVSENTGLRSILSMDIADKALLNIHEEVITEKFSLNTVKLALQNAKAKLRDLSTKEKSMWQAVDAQSSGLVKSIEKALTSDRREAIIKGSIIPSFSKCVRGAIALAGVGLLFGPMNALVTAIGGLALSSALNAKERKLLFDEIDTELKVVEKEIDIAQNDGDMKKYRFLLNYQKKLTREYQRIKYGLRVQGRDIPAAVIPGRK